MVVLRPPAGADRAALIATRDDEFRRFMGEGDPDPHPAFCITAGGEVVGWIDYDRDERAWLTHDEVNIGYGLHPRARGKGYVTRAVPLLLHHLAVATDVRVGTLAIKTENARSHGVARRTRFGEPVGPIGDGLLSKRPVPPVRYRDGRVTIRPPRVDDAEPHVEAVDDAQMRWMWLPGQREAWEAMSPEGRVEHTRRWLAGNQALFATGPKWCFTVELDGACAGYVDCDLANPRTPAGEAIISYSTHPGHRGKGCATAAVGLVLQFLRDHTGARRAHVLVDERNEPSARVLRAAARRHHESSISISPPSSPISISTESSTLVGTFTV